MDDLISRKVAMDTFMEKPYDYYHTSYIVGELNCIPSVPAVPLNKLCEMLDKCNITVPCNDDCEGCEAFDGTGDTVNCWKATLTKWMEGLDAAD